MNSRVHPNCKTKYRVTNWNEYEQALVQRGDITVWLSPAAIKAWNAKPSGRRGAPRKYSDLAIETAITLRLVFHLPLRQTEGFLNSLFEMMDLDLSAPDHTTLSRRSQQLNVKLRKIGRRRWKKESGYHRQGTVENAFFRYKLIVGDRLRARCADAQKTEALVACNVLNRMLELGRPKSRAVAA